MLLPDPAGPSSSTGSVAPEADPPARPRTRLADASRSTHPPTPHAAAALVLQLLSACHHAVEWERVGAPAKK